MSDTDDPFKPAGVTIVRPQPGAGRRQAREAGAQFQSPTPRVPLEPTALTFRDGVGGLNRLVAAALPLLLLSGQLRGMAASPDVAALRRYSLDEIRRFEAGARSAGVPNEVVLSA